MVYRSRAQPGGTPPLGGPTKLYEADSRIHSYVYVIPGLYQGWQVKATNLATFK